MKTVFIGSVISSKVALETLVECNVRVDLVCSLDAKASSGVSDYFPIHEIAEKHQLPFIKFNKISEQNVVDTIREFSPDFIFVVGLSQIIPQAILDMANRHALGFHPTPLPKFRGRAALPWQVILGVRESKVSLFKLDAGMDSGDLICQTPYQIEEDDYVIDVYHKVCEAMKASLIHSIPLIYGGKTELIKQNDDEATYLLIRRPEDGKINWEKPGAEIHTLIRATSTPYPGAFSYYKGKKVIFWRANLEVNTIYTGIPGQIAWIKDSGEIGVIMKDSMLILNKYELDEDMPKFRVGHKFE